MYFNEIISKKYSLNAGCHNNTYKHMWTLAIETKDDQLDFSIEIWLRWKREGLLSFE